ncbi:MAG TPA: CoA pyrophosphatase [Thermoanaerobaculia bacterium]|nr:CoA pyrophosphatase [Thermoanaerobaculia bacterium]
MPAYPIEHDDVLRAWVEARVRRFEWRAIESPGSRRAAVAVTLAPNRELRSCFLLTRRAKKLTHHGGQWALPGGRMEEGESAADAARRELDEELGLSLDALAIVGRLDDFETRSGFVISPVVLWCEDYRELTPDPREVARAYRVPIADLDRPDVPILSHIPQSDRPVLSMPILGGKVHAPTAAFIYQLLEVALYGRATRVAHYEQPVFAWR